MRQLNGLDWFLGATYHTPLKVSLLRDLVTPVRDQLETVDYSGAAVARELAKWINKSQPSRGPLQSPEEARHYVLTRQLQDILSMVDRPSLRKELELRRDYQSYLRGAFAAAEAEMDRANLRLAQSPKLNFVNAFPAPYDASDAVIIACDEGDRKAFGIDPGLYIKDSYRPFYTEFIIYHEMIHLYLGERSPETLCGRLEEGWAELLGAGWLALKFMPRHLVFNLFVVNRLSSTFVGQWERYLDATRQAWIILQGEGLSEVLAMTRRGRQQLEKLEADLYREIGVVWKTPSSDIPQDLAGLMSGICDVFPRSLVCSPQAFLVAPFAVQGETVREIAVRAGLTVELAVDAIEELQAALGLAALRPDKTVLSFSVAPAAALSGLLRFDAKSDAS